MYHPSNSPHPDFHGRPQDPRPVPYGWESHFSDQYNCHYYVDTRNPQNPVSQWHFPDAYGGSGAPFQGGQQTQRGFMGDIAQQFGMGGIQGQNQGQWNQQQGQGYGGPGVGGGFGQNSGYNVGYVDPMNSSGWPDGTQGMQQGNHHNKHHHLMEDGAVGLGGAAIGFLAAHEWDKHKAENAYKQGVAEGVSQEQQKELALQAELTRVRYENAQLQHQQQQYVGPPSDGFYAGNPYANFNGGGGGMGINAPPIPSPMGYLESTGGYSAYQAQKDAFNRSQGGGGYGNRW